MKCFDKSLARELNAKNETQYAEKKQDLEKCIVKGKEKLKQISTFHEFFQFCVYFKDNCGFNRPIDIESHRIDKKDFKKLGAYKYPSDFLE